MLVLAISLHFSSASADPPLVPSECESAAWSNGGCVVVCPAGDGTTLDSVGATIQIRMISANGTFVPGVPPDAYYLRTPNDGFPCPGWSSFPFGAGHIPLEADNTTDHTGRATISGALPAMMSGYANSIVVEFTPDGTSVVPFRCSQGEIHCCPEDLAVLPIKIRSPDFNEDGCVNVVDFGIFGAAYPSNPASDPRCDLNGDGKVGLGDFAIFGSHQNHECANGGCP
jgi:hypothetical protein